MPRIPIYESQVGVPEGPGLPRASAADFGGEMAGAFHQLGNATQRIEANLAQQDEQNAAVDVSTRASQARVFWQQDLTQRQQSYQPGDASFIPKLSSDYDQYATAQLNSVDDPRARKYLALQLNGIKSSVLDNAISFAANKNIDAQHQSLVAANDADGNALLSDPSQFPQILGNATGRVNALPLDVVSKQQLVQQTGSSLARAAVMGTINQDPVQAKAQLDAGLWDNYLRPDDKSVLVNHAEVRISQADAQVRQQADAQRQAIGQQLEDIAASLRAGVPVDPAVVSQAAGAANAINRPELGRQIATIGRANSLAAQARLMTPTQLQDRIAGLDDRIASAGPDANAQDYLDRQTLAHVAAAQATGLAHDPLNYAAQSGVVRLQPVDLNDPATLTDRRQTAHAVASYYNTQPSFLTEAESHQISAEIDQGTPQQKLAIAQQLAQGFGADAGSVFKTLGQKSPVFGYAGSMANQGPAQAATALKAFTGQTILAANPALVPPAPKLQAASQDVLGPALALRPETQASALSVAKAIYAADASRQGLDASGFDEKMWGQALNEALGASNVGTDGQRGGLYVPGTAGAAGFFRRNNNQIVLPPSLSGQEFDDTWYHLRPTDLQAASVGGAPPHDAKGNVLSPEVLRDGYLYTVGNGLYAVSLDPTGTQFVRGSGPNGFYVLDIAKARAAVMGAASHQKGETP